MKGYRVLDPETNKIEVARDVKFLVNEVGFALPQIEQNKDHCDNVNEQITEPVQAERQEEETDEVPPLVQAGGIRKRRPTALSGIESENIIPSRLRSRDDRDSVNHLVAYFSILSEPNSYDEAVASNDHKQWERAMEEEFDSLMINETWELVPKPEKQKVIDNKWVYKVKTNPSGSVDRYKARLVARGFNQQYGIDYEETFSPVIRFNTLRTLLSIAAANKMILKQFDVKTAFLYGELKEDVYMHQPIGFDDNTDRVCKLRKSLFGLKQASRCWNHKFKSFIEKFGFVACQSDPCVFVKSDGDDIVILALYVDDGLVTGNNTQSIDLVIHHLRNEFVLYL